MEANAAQSTSADTALFEQLDSYDWDSDEDFKNGLEAILGANPSPEQAAELTLRARCFYYDRYILYRHLHTQKRLIQTTENIM